MPYGITQCFLPPGRGDIPALTPAEAGTRLSDPGGMQDLYQMSPQIQALRLTTVLRIIKCSYVCMHVKMFGFRVLLLHILFLWAFPP